MKTIGSPDFIVFWTMGFLTGAGVVTMLWVAFS